MSREIELATAKATMRKFLWASEAISWLRAQPLHSLQIHLLAESEDQNRRDILGYFPKVGPQFRSKYLTSESTKKETTNAS